MRSILKAVAVLAIACVVFPGPLIAQERTGVVVTGPSVTQVGPVDALAAIARTGSVVGKVCTASLAHTNAAQAHIFSQSLQGFPTNGPSFLSLASGPAAAAPGSYESFLSTSYGGNRDTAALTVNCACPTGRTSLSIDATYCTEENPTYKYTIFQDPFLIRVTDNTGPYDLVSLTVDGAIGLSNAVTGSSTNPTGPPPIPNDVEYNACLLPANRYYDVGRNLYGPVTLLIRQQDAGDDILDSAGFVDDLNVICRLEIDLKPGSNPNCTNLQSKGVVAVAVLSGLGFDPATIDQGTIFFAGAKPLRCSFEYLNPDLVLDLVCHFSTQDLMVGPLNKIGCAVVDLKAMAMTPPGPVPVSGSDILCVPGDYACNNHIPQTPPF